jgi:hypothetical protein
MCVCHYTYNSYFTTLLLSVLLDHLLTYYNIIRIICQEHYVTQSQKCPKIKLPSLYKENIQVYCMYSYR